MVKSAPDTSSRDRYRLGIEPSWAFERQLTWINVRYSRSGTAHFTPSRMPTGRRALIASKIYVALFLLTSWTTHTRATGRQHRRGQLALARRRDSLPCALRLAGFAL